MVIVVVMVTGPSYALFFATISIDINLIVFYYMFCDLLVELQDTLSSLCIINNASILTDKKKQFDFSVANLNFIKPEIKCQLIILPLLLYAAFCCCCLSVVCFVCTFTCVGTLLCVCMWKLKVWCDMSSIILYMLRQWLLLNPELIGSPNVSSQLVQCCLCPFICLMCTEITGRPPYPPSFFYEFWGFELHSSHLHSKPFTHQSLFSVFIL